MKTMTYRIKLMRARFASVRPHGISKLIADFRWLYENSKKAESRLSQELLTSRKWIQGDNGFSQSNRPATNASSFR